MVVGSLTANLGIFRGIALTIFVFFLLQKWAEIKWGKYWSFGLLGFGGLIYASCIIIKSNVELFMT